MKKRVGLVILVVLVFLIVILFNNFYNNKNEAKQVCFINSTNDKTCFEVEIADNDKEREKGLMFREADSLKEDEGMLFVFEKEGIYSFWMKNTLISLDMIWINEDKKVVFILDNVQPCERSMFGDCPVFTPSFESLYVLEVNANSTRKYGIEVGDGVEMR